MNLADMLSYADIHELGKIADNYSCACNGHSKNELIQSILTTVNRREVFDSLISGLGLEDIRFLNSLMFDPRGSFSLEELIARVQQSRIETEGNAEGWNPRDMIARFKRRGWLFNGHSQQTRYLFHVPNDLKKRFGDVLASHFRKSIVAVPEPPVYRDEQKLIVDDIYYFLHYVYQQETALTADGVMYKRSIQQVLDRLSVKEEQVAKTAWRFGYGRRFREYPNRLSLIYDYCYYNDWISEQDQTLSLTIAGRERVESGHKDDLMNVYRFWLKLYKNPVPNVQSIVQWLDKLAPNWVTCESVQRVLCPLLRPFYYDSPESIMDTKILQMMMHLGLLRIGEDETYGKVIRITKLGSGIIHGTYVGEEERVPLPIDN